uniref:Uncharacterized protein n=1 Tax=viral metagenome TaxID=1070528 RepID=A0A6M3MGT4_9ZZZZ
MSQFNQGSIDPAAVIIADWSVVRARYSNTWYDLGTCKGGVATVTRGTYEHMDTSYPRQIDVVIPTSLDMSFEGDLDEPNRQNVALVTGLAPNFSGVYMYYGALAAPVYFTLFAERERPDLKLIQFLIYKAAVTGEASMGSADEAVPVHLAAKGVSDQDGSYGSTAEGRMGWWRVPAKS